MEAWLRQNPPKRSQYRSPRRAKPNGVTVIHTAENPADLTGSDSGAEGIARFIQGRSDPGSYHDIGDSDSSIKLVRYSDEAFQDGTGSNPYALSISFALKTSNWAGLSKVKRAAYLRQGALAFKRQQDWLKANGYPTTPLRRITKAQCDAGARGFIAHADRDPGRRSDPGADFPWAEWFAACKSALAPTQQPQPEPTPMEDDMQYLVTDARDPSWQPTYITDLITKRWIKNPAELSELTKIAGARLVRKDITPALLDSIPTVGTVPVKS